MSKITRLSRFFFILGFLGFLFLGGRPVESGQEQSFFEGLPISKPVIRIALGLSLEDVHIHASSDLKIYRVAEGYESSAEVVSEALPGSTEARILRVAGAGGTAKPRWITVNDELVALDERMSLYLIPASPQSRLTYGGKDYRGIFVLRGGLEGTNLINVLNLEDYLKSVVPGELSPYLFGEIEALKAQAIAARTYALKNVGQFDDLGFDLYATPRSQLYDGMGVEHPLSSRAVDETKGEVAVYDGKLINALYTCTCGGATEDAEAMFEGNAVPYLRSTTCVMESGRGWTLRTGQNLPTYFAGGCSVSPKIAALEALGILAPNSDPDWYRSPLPAEEAAAWIEKAAPAMRKMADEVVSPLEPATGSVFSRWIMDARDRHDRAKTLAGMSESAYATENPAGPRAEERSLRTNFLISGVIPSMTSAAPPEGLTRAEAAAALSDMIKLQSPPFHRANLIGVEKNVLLVAEDGETRSITLDPNPYFVRSMDGSVSLASSLDLEPGQAVQWIEREGRVRWLQVSSQPLANVHDRPSQYHSWQVRTARQDLEARLNQYYPIGRLIDLVPLKRGASQRVIELSIIGEKSRVLVTGLSIRRVLNLRDSLFVIDREADEEGQPTHFIFSGRGWGHGVGLCQVGAFLMARNGSTYEEILKTYYHGIEIEKRPGY